MEMQGGNRNIMAHANIRLWELGTRHRSRKCVVNTVGE